MVFALIGNQNCGKTTLFNALTGLNQHVGNFPGVTVDQKSGTMLGHNEYQVVDLPGIYSLRTYTQEENVALNFLLNNNVDVIINIVDATNIERNLYLTLQLLELQKPTVIAMNMIDELRNNGGSIDIESISKKLGVSVVPISAINGEGLSELTDKVIKTAKEKVLPAVSDFCSNDSPVHRCIHAIIHLIDDHSKRIDTSTRFCATKLIEGNNNMAQMLILDDNEKELIEHCIIQMESETGFDRNEALADMRYSFVDRIVSTCVVKPSESKEHLRTEKIDRILTGKYTAIPSFLGIMALIFYLTFNVIGAFFQDILASGVTALTLAVNNGLVAYGINDTVRSLVVDGIFTGVGSVISFLPIIIVLFFFLSILEDSGYMARIAFFMDGFLRKIGLSGKSFVPMLIGFGCTVPAIMATRTLSSDRDRKLTILLTPYMSCSAKIPIYSIFAMTFFPEQTVLAMLVIYTAGILVGIFVASIMQKTVFRGKPIPFLMELPDYRLPGLRTTGRLLWDKAKDFIQRAFTVIFLSAVAIWFLQTFDAKLNVVSDTADSLLALLGHIVAPIFVPIGFGDWRIVTSLIAGITAKEAVVSTLTVLLKADSDSLSAVLKGIFSVLTAASFLAFTLLYTPCVAAIAAIKREWGSRVQTVVIVIFQCVVAWLVAFAIYNLGLIFV